MYRTPDFATFLARLQPALLAPNASETEERGCHVCFLFEETLFQLPCHASHRACKPCLSTLQERDKPYCPLCSTVLFINEARQHKIKLRYYIATNTILAYTFQTIALMLKLYKGYYGAAKTLLYFMVACSPAAWFSLYRLRRESSLVELSVERLLFIHVSAMCFAFGAAYQVLIWDNVTLWDGAVLQGVEVWDPYPVVRELYGAAA